MWFNSLITGPILIYVIFSKLTLLSSGEHEANKSSIELPNVSFLSNNIDVWNISRKASNLKIIGGREVLIQNYPYVACIWAKDYKREYVFVCGSVIITKTWLLTAAHCIKTIKRLHAVKRSYVRSDSATWEKCYTERQIIEYHVHEKYNRYTEMDYDIALIRVAEAFNGRWEIPIAISKTRWISPRDKLTVLGWGSTISEDIHIVKHLRAADIFIVEQQTCKDIWSNETPIQITDRMLCALGPGKDACVYDSGGPLVHKGKLIGLVSFGIPMVCADPIIPGVYTDVRALRKWVKHTMKYHLNLVRQIDLF